MDSLQLVNLKKYFYCPIKQDYTLNPIMTRCCGIIVDELELFRLSAGQLNGKCPNCQIAVRTILDNPHNNALKNIASLLFK